jgi:hypothetical protein
MRARETESKGADPVRVFLILAGILVAIGVVFWLTRSDPIPDAAIATFPSESPDFSLTNVEAIARFKELHSLFRQGSRERDLSVLNLLFTRDSPLRQIATDDVRQLRKDGVLDRSTFRTTEIEVVSNVANEIVLLQRVEIEPRFILEQSGKDIADPGPLNQQVRWVLHQEAGVWKVYDSKVLESE